MENSILPSRDLYPQNNDVLESFKPSDENLDQPDQSNQNPHSSIPFTSYKSNNKKRLIKILAILGLMIFLIAVAILIFDKTTSALGIFSYFGLNTNNSISKEIEDGSPTPEIPVAEITFEEDESLESVQIEEQTVVTPTPTPAITPNPVAKPSSTFTPNPTTLPAPASTSVPEANIDLNLERVEISEDSTIETRSESNWATSSTTGVFKSNLGIGVTWFAIRNNGHEDAKNVQVKVIVDQKTITTFNIGIIQKTGGKLLVRN